MQHKLTALLIEDDAPTAKTTASILASAGFSVITALTGAEGIDKLTKNPFDLVIVDLQLPDIKGPRLIEVLRGSPNGMATKIIVVTSSQDNDEFEAAERAGADGLYQKTIGLNVLAAKFARIAKEFQDEAKTVCRLIALEELMHTHSEELRRCSNDKDAQIAEMSTLLKQIAADTASVREIVTAWNQAKAFVGFVKAIGTATAAMRWPIMLITSIFAYLMMGLKTGIWHFEWPKLL